MCIFLATQSFAHVAVPRVTAAAIGEACKELMTLSFQACGAMTDVGIAALAEGTVVYLTEAFAGENAKSTRPWGYCTTVPVPGFPSRLEFFL